MSDLNANLALAQRNAEAFGDKARKANEALKGGTEQEHAFKDIEATHGADGEGGDKDKVAEAKEKIDAITRESAGLGTTEDAIAKRRELEEKLATELKSLSDAEKEVTAARIDAEIAEEEKGSAKKKELLRQKFEVETKGVAPNSADYINKASALKTALEEEPDKTKAKKPEKDDDLEAEIKELEGEVAAEQRAYDEKVALYSHLVKMHEMTEEEKLDATRKAAGAEYAAQLALYQEVAHLEDGKPEKRQETLNKIEALEAAHNKQLTQLSYQAAEEQAKVWAQEAQQMAGTLSSSVSQALEGLVEHTHTKDAGKKLAQSLFNSLADDLVKSTLTKPLETALRPTFKGLDDAISQPLEQGFQKAVDEMMSMAQPFISSLASALSGVFGGLGGAGGGAGIGSLLGGLGLALPAFDVGTNYVPRDMPAFVHQGERIVPAADNQALMSALNGGGNRGGAPAPTVHSSTNVNISAMDARSVSRAFHQNDRELLKAIGRAAQRGAHLGIKGL